MMTFESKKFYNPVVLYDLNFVPGIIPDPYPWKEPGFF